MRNLPKLCSIINSYAVNKMDKNIIESQLKKHINTLRSLLDKFVSDSALGMYLPIEDESLFKRINIEIRDLLDDYLGNDNRYSNEISATIINNSGGFLSGISYAGVSDVIAIVEAALTKVSHQDEIQITEVDLEKKKNILEKLVESFNDPSIDKDYESNDVLISWSSKIIPLLQFNPQYQSKFITYQEVALVAHLRSQNRQAFQLMKSQVAMAMEELKLMIDLEDRGNNKLQEKFFPKGFYYDATKALGDIIKSAKTKIYLIDNYIDEEILEFFTIKEKSVELYIITQNIKSGIKHYAKQYSLQYGNLEIRLSNDYHDRFIIIDEKIYYHFGASLKDLGKKAFMFSEIQEDDNKIVLLDKWKKDWSISSNII